MCGRGSRRHSPEAAESRGGPKARRTGHTLSCETNKTVENLSTLGGVYARPGSRADAGDELAMSDAATPAILMEACIMRPHLLFMTVLFCASPVHTQSRSFTGEIMDSQCAAVMRSHT